MVLLAADGIIGFSRLPLRVALQGGLLVSALSIGGAVLTLWLKLLGFITVPGWASLVFMICLLGGIQLAVMGLISEYLGRTYEESLGRPLYIVSDLSGLTASSRPVPARAVIAPPRPRRPEPAPRAVVLTPDVPEGNPVR
jgi:hypothetical protein